MAASAEFCNLVSQGIIDAASREDFRALHELTTVWRKSGCEGTAIPMADIPNPLRAPPPSEFVKIAGDQFVDFGRTEPTDPFSPTLGGGGSTNPLVQVACSLLGIDPSRCSVTAVIAAGGAALLGGGDDDTGAMDPSVPGSGLADPGPSGPCPNGAIQVGDRCIAPGDLFPGGDPGMFPAGFQPVRGIFGAGFTPKQTQRTIRVCPPDHVLGEDNVCYDSLPRSKRKWDPGMKPLLTGGDRAAIRKAATAARKLKRSKKQLKKASRALDKVT